MFNSRYFSDRYFAPRFWPKVGADPAPPSGGAGVDMVYGAPTHHGVGAGRGMVGVWKWALGRRRRWA